MFVIIFAKLCCGTAALILLLPVTYNDIFAQKYCALIDITDFNGILVNTSNKNPFHFRIMMVYNIIELARRLFSGLSDHSAFFLYGWKTTSSCPEELSITGFTDLLILPASTKIYVHQIS